jgi:hypothetical protein
MASVKDSLLNGSSLSHLTGAETRAKIHVEVALPISSIQEVFETIERLGYSGGLTAHFLNGKPKSLKWSSTRDTKPPEI